ncbi:MAG: hypothetical protein IT330_00835 [Anaerolineae bacterium]|nr:hypothetical protein [Anaerolineae bacterium]
MRGQINFSGRIDRLKRGGVILALLLGLVACSQPPTPTPTVTVPASPTANDLLPPMPPGFDGPLPSGTIAAPTRAP